MAASVSVSSLNSVPKLGFQPDQYTSRARVLVQRPSSSVKNGHGHIHIEQIMGDTE